MFLEPCFEPALAGLPYSLDTMDIGLVLSAATTGMVLTMTLAGALSGKSDPRCKVDPHTQQAAGFICIAAALPFLGPSTQFHLEPNLPLFIGAITATYIGVGLVGPTQSVLCLRILSAAGLDKEEVAPALAAANVTFSTLGSLVGPLVAGALVPKVLAFDDATSFLAIFTACAFLPSMIMLARFKPGPQPMPCIHCVRCCCGFRAFCAFTCFCCPRSCCACKSCCPSCCFEDKLQAEEEQKVADGMRRWCKSCMDRFPGADRSTKTEGLLSEDELTGGGYTATYLPDDPASAPAAAMEGGKSVKWQ